MSMTSVQIQKALDDLVKARDEARKLAAERIIEIHTELQAENKRLKQWVSDLQSGMYINCVYCGHRYGPKDEVPVAMADVLKEHIEQCPEHPMSKLKDENKRLKEAIAAAIRIKKLWLPEGVYGAATRGEQEALQKMYTVFDQALKGGE